MSDAQEAPDALQDRLVALRTAGAWRQDPARFHYLEALARRLPGQPEPVRRLLEGKLQAGLGEFAERASPPAAKPTPIQVRPAVERTPLAQLNAYLRESSPAARRAAPGEPHERDELASVRRFRRAWASLRMHEQVEQAAARKPANAGPLNSHALVLQSLALMRELSPDYLERFLRQVESLQWLDRAAAQLPQRQSGAAKAGKAKAPKSQPARRSKPKA